MDSRGKKGIGGGKKGRTTAFTAEHTLIYFSNENKKKALQRRIIPEGRLL